MAHVIRVHRVNGVEHYEIEEIRFVKPRPRITTTLFSNGRPVQDRHAVGAHVAKQGVQA